MKNIFCRIFSSVSRFTQTLPPSYQPKSTKCEKSFLSVLPKQIVGVLLNADMDTSAGEGEGIVQAGMKFLYFYMF